LSAIENIWPGFLQPMALPLTLILFPALAAVVGGILVEWISISKQFLSNIYHFSGGLVLGIVGIQLMPEVIQHHQEWLIILFFLLGGSMFLLVDWLTDFIPETLGISLKKNTPWPLFFGLAIDLVTDGMLIASGSNVQALGFSLAFASAIVSLPEAFAANASFKRRGFSNRKLTGMAVVQGLLMIVGVPLGYWIVHGHPKFYTYLVISFTAGFLATLLAEEVLPRAHTEKDARFSAFLFLFGFALIAYVAAYIG
jgi:zinc transporter, ZIP family